MEHFSQKWALVSLLGPIDESTQFSCKAWPLHVTLAGSFAVNWADTNLLPKLVQAVALQKPVSLRITKQVQWGKNNVMLLEKTPEIAAFHQRVHALLAANKAVFSTPDYFGDGYMPHVTMQKDQTLRIGDIISLDSISIVDMFPGGDGLQRKITKTIQL